MRDHQIVADVAKLLHAVMIRRILSLQISTVRIVRYFVDRDVIRNGIAEQIENHPGIAGEIGRELIVEISAFRLDPFRNIVVQQCHIGGNAVLAAFFQHAAVKRHALRIDLPI